MHAHGSTTRTHAVPRRAALSACVLSILLASDPWASAQPAPDTLAAPVMTDPVEGAIATLRSSFATREDREAAARALLASEDARARSALLEALGSTPPADAASIVLQQAGRLSSAPPWMVEPLASIARAKGDQALPALMALGSVRSRSAARALVTIAGESATPPELVQQAVLSLARLSGRDDIAPDPKAWATWVAQVEWLTEAEWRRVLGEALAARADGAVRVQEIATARLLEYLRREFQEAPAEDRSRLLERSLRDELPAVRTLGFQLALQELANARPLDVRVARGALDLLSSPDVPTRRAAAELLNVTAPAEFAERLANALIAENSPGVARWLLSSMVRRPSVSVLPAALRWLESGDAQAAFAAVDLLEALHERRWLQNGAERERAAAAVRRSPELSSRPSGVRLLFALGGPDDRSRLLALIDAADAPRRSILAESLAREPAGVDPIVDRARADRALFQAAVQALGAHRPTAASVELARGLAAPTADARRSALVALTARLSTGQLLAAAREEPDLELREAMLSRLTSEPLVRVRDRGFGTPRAGSPRFTQHPSVVAGLLLLSRTRLELGQPALAIRALDALAPMAASLDDQERDGLRTTALLWLNRVEDAAALNADVLAWLDGLDYSVELAHADRVLQAIETRFGASMTEAHRKRLAQAQSRMTTFIGPRAVP